MDEPGASVDQYVALAGRFQLAHLAGDVVAPDRGVVPVRSFEGARRHVFRHGVDAVARAALGADYDPRLTCHKYRHYFVTLVLRKTDNLKIAQAVARHKNIGNTQRYAHVNEGELDRKLAEIFS